MEKVKLGSEEAEKLQEMLDEIIMLDNDGYAVECIELTFKKTEITAETIMKSRTISKISRS